MNCNHQNFPSRFDKGYAVTFLWRSNEQIHPDLGSVPVSSSKSGCYDVLCKHIFKNREKTSHLKGTTRPRNCKTMFIKTKVPSSSMSWCNAWFWCCFLRPPGFGSMILTGQQEEPRVKLMFKQFLRWTWGSSMSELIILIDFKCLQMCQNQGVCLMILINTSTNSL